MTRTKDEDQSLLLCKAAALGVCKPKKGGYTNVEAATAAVIHRAPKPNNVEDALNFFWKSEIAKRFDTVMAVTGKEGHGMTSLAMTDLREESP